MFVPEELRAGHRVPADLLPAGLVERAGVLQHGPRQRLHAHVAEHEPQPDARELRPRRVVAHGRRRARSPPDGRHVPVGDEHRERRAVDRVVDEVVRRRREVQQVVHPADAVHDVVGHPRRPVTEHVDGAPVQPSGAGQRLTCLGMHRGDRGEHVTPLQLTQDPGRLDALAELVVDPDPPDAVGQEGGSHAVGQGDALAQQRTRGGPTTTSRASTVPGGTESVVARRMRTPDPPM